MARVNYSFRKKQKELKREKKREEKRQRKLDKKNIPSAESEAQVSNAERESGPDKSPRK